MYGVINENPARQIQLTFRESDQPDTIDARLTVKDSSPVCLVNHDNSGSEDEETYCATLALSMVG